MSSLIPHDYRYKISSPTPVDKEPFFSTKKVSAIHNIALTFLQTLINDKSICLLIR